MNFRELLKIDRPYFQINREERHLAAILFHILNLPDTDNVTLLLQRAGCDWRLDKEEFGVYFEYSHLRDLWHSAGQAANDVKRTAVLEMLRKTGSSDGLVQELTTLAPAIFNGKFIGAGASANYIQSPANWQLPRFADWITDANDLMAVCQLKWAFKAKPDVVIQPNRGTALCVELKLESGEGSYPASASEKTILKKRGLFGPKKDGFPFPVSQTSIQRHMMRNLLGLECRFLFITRNGSNISDSPDTQAISWDRLLQCLKRPTLPSYMEEALTLAGSAFDNVALKRMRED